MGGGRGDAAVTNRLDMAEVGAAAAAEDVELRELLAKLAVLVGEFLRIASVEIRAFIQFGVAAELSNRVRLRPQLAVPPK